MRQPITSTARLARASEAARWARVSRSTWHAWVAAGRIPPGIKLSPGVTVWNLDEIAEVLNGGAV